MPSPTEITVNQLARLIGTPDAPLIIDVRIDEDFDLDPLILPTAKRWSHLDINNLANSLKTQKIQKKVIVYCQKGKKISQGCFSILRAQGIQAESLEGGHYAWRDAKQTLVPVNKLPSTSHLWVTKHRPKIDRIACPWLIRRFIDPTAQFLFVAPSEVLGVAEKFNATPFDVEDVFWTHRGENGEICTFDVMLEEFNIKIPALERLAQVVRGADTNQHDLAPESAGLLAVSLGLSRMYKDDNQQLDAGMLIYDALYRWARDASNESHDWPITHQSTNK